MNFPSLEELKTFAHRTPMRYMRDDDCPYQFAEHNLINFARLIIAWRDAQYDAENSIPFSIEATDMYELRKENAFLEQRIAQASKQEPSAWGQHGVICSVATEQGTYYERFEDHNNDENAALMAARMRCAVAIVEGME